MDTHKLKNYLKRLNEIQNKDIKYWEKAIFKLK